MHLDHHKLHTDILIKLNKENKSRKKLAKELGFSPDVIDGLRDCLDIRIGNFLKIIKWIDNDIYRYLK